MTKSTIRKLEALRHRWLRKILHISWKDKVTNDKVKELAQQGLLENIIRERRLRWAGHVVRMDSRKIARQATNWKPIDGRRRPGRPRTDWQQTVKVGIRGGGINWEQIPDLAVDS